MVNSYYRRVITIRGEDSPNVRYALAEIAAGREPSHRILCPGVLTYAEYVRRRKLWDKIRQCIGLDAKFWEGKEDLMYPPEWLNLSEHRAGELRRRSYVKRYPKGIGIDTAEGGDKTAMAAGDELGLLELVAKHTPDTSVIIGDVIAFGRKWGIPPERWVFDAGGGGKQHADTLRKKGYAVRTVRFGESVLPDLRRGLKPLDTKREEQEQRYVYKNRRAKLYGELRNGLDPDNERPWSIPAGSVEAPQYEELRRQLSPIPMWYDDEGRIYLPPKRRKSSAKGNASEVTMESLIGCSPDEADATVLCYDAVFHESGVVYAGVPE